MATLTGHTEQETKNIASMGGLAKAENERRMKELLWGKLGSENAITKRGDLIDRALDGENLKSGQWRAIDTVSRELNIVLSKRISEDGGGKAETGNVINIQVQDQQAADDLSRLIE